MSIYPEKTPATAKGIEYALEASNAPSADNKFITEKDVITTGFAKLVLISPDGTKFNVTVADNGTLAANAVV